MNGQKGPLEKLMNGVPGPVFQVRNGRFEPSTKFMNDGIRADAPGLKP